MDNLFIGYIEDLKDYIITFNEALITIENDFTDEEIINTIFRVAHTIKGNSAAMKFMKIKEVMHTMEDILHQVREGKRTMDSELLSTLFICHDFLEDCIEVLLAEKTDDNMDIEDILNTLQTIKNEISPIENDAALTQNELELNNRITEDKNVDKIMEECPFHISEDSFDLILENVKRGMTLIHLKVMLREDSEMKSIRNIILFNDVEEHGFVISSIPKKPDQEMIMKEGFVFDHIETQMLILTEKNKDEISEIIKKEPDIDRFQCDSIPISAIKQISERTKKSIEKVNDKQEKITNSKEPQLDDFVRVSSQKVDMLIEMLGELLIFHSQLEQHAHTELCDTENTMNILPRMAKLIKNIQDLSMTLRMVSIKPVLHKLTRITRDTAAELDKKVTVIIEGENTEIDKSASEKIFDPLMHIVRNAVSHGIESEEIRKSRGKKPEGTIKISAYSKRSQVYIEVSDDGGGMCPELIYKKAKEKNMVDEEKSYTDEEIIRFIFMPGFSTNDDINTISGRGVGMNVVESELTKLRGKIDIKNEPGKGCTFILKIPMNLAVLNGTVIEIEKNKFIIPTLFIKQFFIISAENWINIQGKRSAVRVRENIIPVITADALLNRKTNQVLDEIREVVILEMDNKLVALPVNKIIGRQEIVAKPLNEELTGTQIFSGASILGDGKVTMILDVEEVFKLI